MNEPTEAQMRWAEEISYDLAIDLPEERTGTAISYFIEKHKNEQTRWLFETYGRDAINIINDRRMKALYD